MFGEHSPAESLGSPRREILFCPNDHFGHRFRSCSGFYAGLFVSQTNATRGRNHCHWSRRRTRWSDGRIVGRRQSRWLVRAKVSEIYLPAPLPTDWCPETVNATNNTILNLALRLARRGYGTTSPNPMV